MLVPDRCLGGERGDQSMCCCTVGIDHTTTDGLSTILCREASDMVAWLCIVCRRKKKRPRAFGRSGSAIDNSTQIKTWSPGLARAARAD